MCIFLIKRRNTLSHAKDQNNKSDIMGIILTVTVSLGLSQKYSALHLLYVQNVAN